MASCLLRLCFASGLRPLTFTDLIYFLSNGVLIVSKTNQSPEKTSGVAGLKRDTQFPINHFSRHSIL